MKRCIFHYPEPIRNKPGTGSAVRPFRMVEAFRELGYQVDEITGYSQERKKKIKDIKQKIKQGIHYDFVYSESINSPTAFADADNFPRHPFMDLTFLRFCRKHRIPVGLFYRDVFWKFPLFKASVAWYKRIFLVPMFRFDLWRYPHCIDLLFLPSKQMAPHVGLSLPVSALPPGGHETPYTLSPQKETKSLHLLYVGSLSSALYDNQDLFHAVQQTPGITLTVCTQKSQWESLKESYAPYLCDRIHVIHKASHELVEDYRQADIATCCLQKNDYLDFAMPIKVFEAINYATPLLVTDMEAVAAFVKQEEIGWVAANHWQSIQETLQYLLDHPEEVVEKTRNTVQAMPRHTWKARAKQVARELTQRKHS